MFKPSVVQEYVGLVSGRASSYKIRSTNSGTVQPEDDDDDYASNSAN